MLLLFFKLLSHKQEKSVGDFQSQFVFNVSSGGIQNFPIIWQHICQTSHENQRIWTERGTRVPSAPVSKYSR